MDGVPVPGGVRNSTEGGRGVGPLALEGDEDDTIRHATTSREAFVPGVQLALERPLTLPPGLTLGLEQLL